MKNLPLLILLFVLAHHHTFAQNVMISNKYNPNEPAIVIESDITEGQKLVTNDVVELNVNDGSFRWLGRFDNVINSGGVKIQLEEVERAAEKLLAESGRVERRLFAAALADEKLGQKLVLVFEDADWKESEKEVFLDGLKNALPKFHAPRELFFVSKFKETESGKVDRIGTLASV